jgi:hypothetical protein
LRALYYTPIIEDQEYSASALELSDHIDHIVPFSGDGGVRSPVEAVQRRGVHVTVVSTLSMIADEPRRQRAASGMMRFISSMGQQRWHRP